MDIIKIINDTAERVKRNFSDCTVELKPASPGWEGDIRLFEEKSGICFSKDIKEMYRNFSSVLIEWYSDGLYGSFDLLPPGDILKIHENMIDIAQSVIEYASEEERKNAGKLDIINNMYPIAEFRSADMMCINNLTGQAVLYEHDADLTIDSINGLVMAESFDELMDKWSRILFLEDFWWETKHGRCVNGGGIDLESPYLKNIMDRFL